MICFLDIKMGSLDFDACHHIANEYYYFHHDDKIRSFNHNVSCSHFVIWIYYNKDDDFDPYHELQKILDIAEKHDLKSKGWSDKAILQTYKALPYELFDNIASVTFSPK